MIKFKVGDRVRVYGGPVVEGKTGTIRKIVSNGMLEIDYGDQTFFAYAHPKQCRKLISKRAKRFWVPVFEHGYGVAWPSYEMAKNSYPNNFKAILEVEEVK
jgi:hypothetical protein